MATELRVAGKSLNSELRNACETLQSAQKSVLRQAAIPTLPPSLSALDPSAPEVVGAAGSLRVPPTYGFYELPVWTGSRPSSVEQPGAPAPPPVAPSWSNPATDPRLDLGTVPWDVCTSSAAVRSNSGALPSSRGAARPRDSSLPAGLGSSRGMQEGSAQLAHWARHDPAAATAAAVDPASVPRGPASTPVARSAAGTRRASQPSQQPQRTAAAAAAAIQRPRPAAIERQLNALDAKLPSLLRKFEQLGALEGHA